MQVHVLNNVKRKRSERKRKKGAQRKTVNRIAANNNNEKRLSGELKIATSENQTEERETE